MRNLRVAALACLALAGAAGLCRASDSAGVAPFNFLMLDANARAVGLGGAYTALAADENALLYNPAGLGRIGQYGATFMHNQYFAGITQEYASLAAPQGWGVNMNVLNSGSIQETTYGNQNGTGLGSTGLTDMAFGAGYGRAVTDSLSLGAGVKYIQENIADVRGRGFAFDVGALYAVPQVKGLSVGAAAQNLGPTVKFQAAKENLPLNVRLGGAYLFDVLGQKSALSFDVTKERSQGALIAVGAETVLAKMMPIRAGFNTTNNAGPGVTAGVGWVYRNFALDYAFAPFGELGMAHRVSVTWRWGAAASEKGPS